MSWIQLNYAELLDLLIWFISRKWTNSLLISPARNRLWNRRMALWMQMCSWTMRAPAIWISMRALEGGNPLGRLGREQTLEEAPRFLMFYGKNEDFYGFLVWIVELGYQILSIASLVSVSLRHSILTGTFIWRTWPTLHLLRLGCGGHD